ncbi:hypothetical protein [Vibrio parahaemolyticus]|uniref:hypothetical protein n=1 Tax=Vibrio parahaemolyticus TaxID=670 RepID=UPI000B4BEFED|nr:hypothetical protein [Vibrio parahaemolyticus]EGR1404018.1 hypothetical protein [Vibrio parahaemolyticus]
MTSSWYRRGTVTVTDGSKEVVGVGTLWMDAGNKPLAGDIMLIAGGIYEVESITDNEHLSLFRAFNGVPPANGEYAIIRNTSVTIATRVAAMVASAINSKQVLIDDLRGYYTSTADKVLIHTDDGSTIEVVPLQTLVSDITKLIDQSESIKDDLVSTDAALSLIRKYSNAAQGVEVEPGMYSAKSYALDASDTLALVNKAKNDVYAQAGEVHETKTDIEQFVSTSKTEITELATTEKAAISQQSTTAISEMTSLKQSAEQAASTATQKATQAAASATSAAQSKTDSQALKTQTEALANETKQVAEEIKSGSYVGWQIYCQSEANMKAARMLASEQFAASGFVHMGTQHSGGNTVGHINEGLWSATAEKNVLKIGRGTSSIDGSSKTNHAVTHIAGFISSLYSVNRSDPTYQPCEIKFPEAPNGTVVYDSTGNCRGSGKATLDLTKDVDPKYGNVATATNEAVGRAFEGQVKNGDFRLGTESWRATYGGNAFSVADGVCTLTSGNSRYTGIEQFVNKHITGLKYDFELTVHEASTDAVLVMSFNNEASGNVTVRASELPKTYRISGILAASAGGNCRFYFDSGDTTAETFKVSGFSWKPVSEEVVINRVDMFGFEYFLEEISKANPFVYPYGCIQSKLTSIEGIATKESNRLITYYSVFDGDTTSKGKGVDFWAATDDQKRALVSNPDHNIYLLDDGRLVQWRVRQRTIAGAGNGKWHNTNSNLDTNWSALMCDDYSKNNNVYVSVKGGQDDVADIVDGASNNYYIGYFNSVTTNQDDNRSKGIFTNRNRTDAGAVNGECYFHVCGVVSRLNQGAYHPSFNPMGAAEWLKQGDTLGQWYLRPEFSRSTALCFHECQSPNGSVGKRLTGKIGGTSGRPDGKFYDAIYASGQGGVIDYRTPAKDMSSKEEASKIFQKVVNGSYRGEETLYGSKVYRIGTATTGFSVNNYRRFDCASVTDVGLTITVGKGRADNTPHNDLNTPRLGFIYDAKTGGLWKVTSFIQDEAGVSRIYTSLASEGAPAGTYTDLYFIGSPNAPYVTTGAQGSEIANLYTNIPASGNFFQQDVIGSPANILTTPALANGWIGSWNPKFHTNYNTIVGTRKNVLGAVARRYTDNLGTAWGSDSPAWDSAKNSFVASSLQPIGRVELWEYTAFAKQTKPSTNKAVLNGSEGVGFVWASADNYPSQGCTLIETLIGKVGKDNQDGNQETRLALTKHFMQPEGTLKKGDVRKHTPIDLKKPINDSPAVKTLWYQIANNQQCSLNFAWNELVWKNLIVKDVNTASSPVKQGEVYVIKADVPLKGQIFKANGNNAGWNWSGMYMGDEGEVYYGGGNSVSLDTTVKSYQGKSDGWGDDSTIRIIDGIGTFINLNNDTCLYGTHELAIPYGYTKNKARAGSQVSGVDL